jgi:hypothetical protein
VHLAILSLALFQWSSLPIQAQAQARGKSLPELQKACGLMGLLVIDSSQRNRIVCGNDYVECPAPLPFFVNLMALKWRSLELEPSPIANTDHGMLRTKPATPELLPMAISSSLIFATELPDDRGCTEGAGAALMRPLIIMLPLRNKLS